MIARAAALVLAFTGAGLSLASAALLFVARDSAGPSLVTGSYAVDIAFALLLASWSLVGGALAYRLPRSPVGWLFLAVGISAQAIELPAAYVGLVGANDVNSLPVRLALWLSLWAWIVPILLIGWTIALLPDGRLPTPRWRWLLALGLAAAMVSPAFALAPSVSDASGHPNPFASDALFLDELAIVANIAVFSFLLGCCAALIVRFRRSRGSERQQLKWIAYAGAVVAVSIVPASVLYGTDPVVVQITSGLAATSVAGFPLAVAVAVLRYRLYDIDLVVNRALVYGVTVATVGAIFVSAALALQSMLRPVTAGSDIAVAVSTLATVAAFQPLRRRVQLAIDRRFYRSRYDAARTLDVFSARLRDQVDIASVRTEVLDVITTTLRPEHAGVWLRDTDHAT